MTFLAPWLLWCVPLAGLPVLFHLFFKVKKRPLAFSSLMFFLKVEPNLQARRKLREILLLILRCLLILLVVLALARPVFPAFGGGGRTALVLVVDNSASMGADGGAGKPRLRQALEGASALLGELKPGDLAALVPAVDERTAAASGLGGDPAVLRAALDQVTATEAAADPARALRQALALLATAPAPAREIHIFTDAQEGEWGRPAGEWGAVPPGVQVVVHRVATGPRPAADVAVAAVHPPLTRIIAGRPARSGVVLVNHGADAATVQLRVTDDQGAETVRPVSVPAHGTVEVPVVLTPAQAGLHHALVRIEGDGFAGDDRAGLAFVCGDRAAVLLSGDPRAFGLLPVALAPDGTGAISGLAPMAVAAADLEREIAERRPALVVITWADLAARTVSAHPDLPALKAYVGGGGALLVLPGVTGLEGGGVAPDWLGASPTRDERLPAPLPALVLAADAACFAEIRDGAGVVDVQGVRIARAVPLKVGTGRATFGLSDGRALLVETALGKGRIFTCGLAFHPAWSSLPLKGWSLAMVQGLALPPPLAADRVLRLTAGQGLPAGTTGTVRIATLAGGPCAWNGPADQAPVFARAGVYALSGGGDAQEPARVVTVAAAPGEGIAVYVEGASLPALTGLAQRVLAGGDAAAAVADWRRSRRGSDLTPWCVVLAILAWLAEGLIGTAGIARPAGPAPGQGSASARAPARDLVGSGSAAIFWLPQVPPLLLAALVALLIIALVVADRRLRARLGAAGGWLLLAPRLGVALLLVLALLDPTVRSEHRDTAHGRLALLIDTSSSMDVADDGKSPRLARARALAARLAAAAPSGVTVTTLAFDTRIRGPLATTYPPGERPGDPGVVLQGAAADPALAGAVAVVALTDGGDEPFTIATPPAVPLSIVGVGTPDGEALSGDNLAVAGVTAPATVEARLDFAIVADLAAEARSPAFAARLADVPVVLQRAEGPGWKDVATLHAALGNGRAQVSFAQTADSPGLRRYRVVLPELPGELSLLDNTRALAIDVREQSLHVLFFTRELGADFKSLRQELARDPGVSFTGLFRITGDRYTLQGDRLDGDAALEKGFPTSADALRRYGCVVLGAFPASGWSEAEMGALTGYVEAGGAAVFLGGERAFAAGGYATTPLAPLLPWALTGTGGLLRGTFPVGVPASASGQPAVAGLQALLAGATDASGGAVLESVNDVGPLRPGATALLESVIAGRPLAVAAIQPYGRGKSVGIATNTLWRLARAGGDGTTAYGRFWRQLVRHAADAGDSSHLARVQWDRERYQPGDEAVATITVLAPPGTAPQLAATLASAGAASETPVPLEAAAGQAGSLRARVRFGERGEYRFRLAIGLPGQADDTYEKIFAIAPRLGEGNHLAVDAAMLSAAAGAAGGIYAGEKDLEPLLAHLRTTLLGKPVTSDLALVGGDPWYLLVFLVLVVGEWWLRRRRHLL